MFKPLKYLSLSDLKLENFVIRRKSGHHRKPDPTSEYQGGDKKTSFYIRLSRAVKKKKT